MTNKYCYNQYYLGNWIIIVVLLAAMYVQLKPYFNKEELGKLNRNAIQRISQMRGR